VTFSGTHAVSGNDAVAQTAEFVRIKNVDKIYKMRGRSLKAIDNVSLDLREGEFVSIVGPSGCGKSTLMMMVAGLVPASSGEISINGQTIRKPYTDVGVIFQRDALLEWRTVLNNVLLQIDVRGLPRKKYSANAQEASASAR
jgi:NitT/TauT family transport system ATP-binding protein